MLPEPKLVAVSSVMRGDIIRVTGAYTNTPVTLRVDHYKRSVSMGNRHYLVTGRRVKIEESPTALEATFTETSSYKVIPLESHTHSCILLFTPHTDAERVEHLNAIPGD